MTQDLTTRLVTVDSTAMDAITQAADLIRAGQLVAFPTETVYGLGANALDAQAVARIFAAKERPATDPLIVHVHSVAQLAEVAIDIPPAAYRLIDAFWPGPLTLVLRRAEAVASAVSAGLPTVAVRMPAHPVALALIRAAQVPIAAPSANRFAHASPTTARHVLDDLDGRVALILDAGPTTIGVESTILDLSESRPRLLRPGGAPLEAIRAVAPDVEVIERRLRPQDGAAPAPGMLLKHYSPRAELRLFEGPDDALRSEIHSVALDLLAHGKRIGLLLADEDRAFFTDIDSPLVTLGSLQNLGQIAHNLFAGLREIDQLPVEIILARTYSRSGLGLAIRDRLMRAAEGRVIHVGLDS